MPSVAYNLARKWHQAGHRPKTEPSFPLIYEMLEFLDKRHYHQFLPTRGSEAPEFLVRLSRWLENVPDDSDRQLLMEFAPRLVFYGRDEFTKLYQVAISGQIARWVIEELGLCFDDPNFDEKLWTELEHHTWYCPVTDSMRIGDFHNANNLGGVEHHPHFRWLAKLAAPAAIGAALPSSITPDSQVREFMTSHKDAMGQPQPLRRIVLLEDFVGVGTQIEKAIQFAATLKPEVPVLFVPLIICPLGSVGARSIAGKYPNVQYSPVVELDEELFINRHSKVAPDSLHGALRDLAIRTYSHVKGNDAAHPRPYTEFGFEGTGATLVMYSNTPANTLPIVHHESNTWRPLFPRSARIR